MWYFFWDTVYNKKTALEKSYFAMLFMDFWVIVWKTITFTVYLLQLLSYWLSLAEQQMFVCQIACFRMAF